MNLYAAKVYAASQASMLTNWLGALTVEQRFIGELSAPSGKIVACDPLIISDPEPFDLFVPAGRYGVSVSIIRRVENGDQRTATALLRLSEAQPRSWQMAVLAGQNTADLKAGEVFCYGVDAGTGCFMDVEAARWLARKLRTQDEFADELVARMEAVYVHTRSWANVLLDEAANLNCILFSSGFGDGCYASYWGFDDQGRLACLMTDFGVLVEPDNA